MTVLAVAAVLSAAVLLVTDGPTRSLRARVQHELGLGRAGSPSSPPRSVFGEDSAWRLDVSGAPVDRSSPRMVASLATQVERHFGGTAAFNVEQFNSSFFIAPADAPRVDLIFDDCQDKGYVPDVLYDPELGAHFLNVAIPDGARPSPGTDRHLSVWSPSTDQLWELWQADEREDGWHACWGGRIDDVSTSHGFFPDGTGAAATGLAYAGGMIGVVEAQQGRIEHALALQAPELDHFDDFSWPAQRSDGYNPGKLNDRIPEGRRLRLKASLDVDALSLHPLAAAVARAAQRYGFIVTDKADAVSVVAESGEATEHATGIDPWDDLLSGAAPHDVMSGFPWTSLEVLPHDYGQPAGE